MAILSSVSAGVLRVGASLQNIGKGFRSSVKTTLGTSQETIARTRTKIVSNAKRVETERKKQDNLSIKERQELENRRREDVVEGRGITKKTPLTLKSVFLEKPMSIMQYLFTAWIIRNAPIILREIRIFTKKVRIFVGAIKRVPGAVVRVVAATLKYSKVFLENVLNFDFDDKKKKMDAARKEFDNELEQSQVTFAELVNVWNRDEETLDKMIKKLDNDKSVAEALENAGVRDFDFGTFPQNSMLGSQPDSNASAGAGGGGSTRGGKVGALLDTISFAEGTPSYGTIYGGAVVPELAAGELTIAEVLKMQKTGKVRGRDAGYKTDGHNSDATGRYQFMSYVLKEEVERQGISMTEKFTPALQDKLILGRIARYRGVTEEKIEKEGLSEDIIDRLAPEFASFPNLKGPDNKGNVGTNTSYYGQGGKSKDQLQGNFSNNIQKQQQAPTPAADVTMPAPQGGAAPMALASAAVTAKNNRLDTSRYGRDGCVYAVNEVYRKAGLTPPWGSSVYVPTARQKLVAAGYSQVSVGNARPGDIVIMLDNHPSEPWVHIGIVGPKGTVFHNSSTNQAFTNEESFASLTRRYVKIEVFRMPTQKATRVANPLISSNPTPSKLDNANAIASKQTGGTRTNTKVLQVTQKEIIMVG